MPRRVPPVLALALLLTTGYAPPAAATSSWSPAQTLATGDHVGVPVVAIDQQGDVLAAWAGSGGVHVASRPYGGAWSEPVQVSTGPSGRQPALALGPGGEAAVVWPAVDYGSTPRLEWVEAAYRPAGGQWSAPTALSGPEAGVGDPQVTVDGAGSATAVWISSDAAIFATRSTVQAVRLRPGSGWGETKTIGPSGAPAAGLGLARNSSGHLIAAWIRQGAATNGQQVWQESVRGDGDGWGAPDVLIGGGAGRGRITLDGRGVASAVWSGRDGQLQRLFAARQVEGEPWSTPAAISPPRQYTWFSVLAGNDKGAAVASWLSIDGPNAQIMAANLRPSGRWSQPQAVSAPSEEDVFGPSVAIDGSGDAVAVWDEVVGGHSRLAVARRAGMGPWRTPGTLSTTPTDTTDPIVVANERGSFAVVWREGTDDTIRAAVSDAPGPMRRG